MRKDHLIKNSLPFNLSSSFLRSRFMNIGIRQGWWSCEKPLVLAVSGGSDSVSMLLLFKEFWNGRVIVAHMEHGIRGQDSLDDAHFVRCLCDTWNIELELKHLSIPDLKQKGESTEQAARRVRYDFLDSVLRKHEASHIAVAHNADDLVETVLHNLIRGTGPFGLVGIPEIRERIIRPVIDFSREELRQILRSRDVSWCEDKTNADITMTRNRIRHKLVPWIEKNINSKAREHIVSLAGNMTFFRDLEDERSSSLVHFLERKVSGCMYSFDIGQARRLDNHNISIFLRSMGRAHGLNSLSRRRLENLVSLIRESGRWQFQWQKSVELCAGQGYAGLVNTSIFSEDDDVSIELPESVSSGETVWNGWRIHWDILKGGSFHPASGSRQSIMPLCGGEPLKICSHNHFFSSSNTGNIPWWIRKSWPVISLGSKIFWFPLLSGVCNSFPESGRSSDRLLRVVVSTADLTEGA